LFFAADKACNMLWIGSLSMLVPAQVVDLFFARLTF
jgi:hypothetical protein